MAISEQSRHELHTKLEETIGEPAATTLMEHLPPVGWADVATKHDLVRLEVATRSDLVRLEEATKSDLVRLEERLDLRFAQIDLRFDHVEQRMATKEDLERALRQQTWRLAGVLITAMGAALGAFAALA